MVHFIRVNHYCAVEERQHLLHVTIKEGFLQMNLVEFLTMLSGNHCKTEIVTIKSDYCQLGSLLRRLSP